MGYYYNIPLTNRKEKMTNKVDLNNIPENFVITYYAKKHKKILQEMEVGQSQMIL